MRPDAAKRRSCPLLERMRLPIRLPFVLGAKSRWLPHQLFDGCWEILIRWKYDGESYYTWVIYSPKDEAVFSEDTEMISDLDPWPCKSTQDLKDYITWVYAGRPRRPEEPA